MNDRLKSAFRSVHAPSKAKQKAMYAVEAHRKNTVRRWVTTGLQIGCACLTAVLAVVFLHVYRNETAYVSLDVNPSISLAVNDYGRVITATGYSQESARLLDSVRVDGMPYYEAVERVMTASDMQPYLASNHTVWIAVQAGNPVTEMEMEQTVEAAVQTALATHYPDMDIAHHAVSEEVRVTAEDAGVTATRYIAIAELQAVDPSASIDAYRHTSIWEIHAQTASHNTPAIDETQHEQQSTATAAPEAERPVPAIETPEPLSSTVPASTAAQGHHGHGAGHHSE